MFERFVTLPRATLGVGGPRADRGLQPAAGDEVAVAGGPRHASSWDQAIGHLDGDPKKNTASMAV